MTTKAQVLRRAETLGCKVDLNSEDVAIHAPKGMLLGQELHISVYPFGEDYSRAAIWKNLWDELNNLAECDGSEYCICSN
jgi:hypothetical protein